MIHTNTNSNPMNSGRKANKKEKNVTASPDKNLELSPRTRVAQIKKINPLISKAKMNIIGTMKFNKRAGLQSAKVSTNLKDKQALFVGVFSPKFKNDRSSNNILPPISKQSSGKVYNISTAKKQLSDK
jgi:hypothetical protein